eukprot:CCRYP_003900-RA/>CCRYP_003900-RA protein AED:0.05 eAED:0.05 QI:130/1/1/1/0.66/0.75/4/550/424
MRPFSWPLSLSLPLLSILTLLASILVAPSDALKLSSLGSWFAHDVPNSDNDACSVGSCSFSSDTDSYGVDISFPIHHLSVKEDNNPFDVQSKRNDYNDFIKGCQTKYSSKAHLCTQTERERLEMNLNQPKSMFNYTSLGFQKTRAPPKLMKLLTKFWNDNTSPSTIDLIPNEVWPAGNTYTNHWSSPTKMLNIRDPSLIGSGDTLRTKIWDETRKILEDWTGVELSPTSLYGIRIYTAGAVLAPHVDRNPLVISAIINVDQNAVEDWPLEVIGHDGKAYNISMEVGDMILYESHSVIHGRPFQLKGEYFANVFCHFEPLGHSLREGQKAIKNDELDNLEQLYQEAWEKQRLHMKEKCQDKGQCHDGNELIDLNAIETTPYYIVPGSTEEKRWIQSHPRAKLIFFSQILLPLHKRTKQVRKPNPI